MMNCRTFSFSVVILILCVLYLGNKSRERWVKPNEESQDIGGEWYLRSLTNEIRLQAVKSDVFNAKPYADDIDSSIIFHNIKKNKNTAIKT